MFFAKKKIWPLLLIPAISAALFALAWQGRPPAQPEEAIYFAPQSTAEVALTFETLWTARGLEELLEILEKNDVRATFFVAGNWLERNREAASKILSAGHELGNHTYSHVSLVYLQKSDIAREIGRCGQLCQDLLEYRLRFFRPPFGEYNDLVLKAAQQYGYRTVMWSVESYDWLNSDSTTVVERVMSRAHGGAIINFRVGSAVLPEALPLIIARLKESGLQPVSVSRLLRVR